MRDPQVGLLPEQPSEGVSQPPNVRYLPREGKGGGEKWGDKGTWATSATTGHGNLPAQSRLELNN